MRRSTVIDKMTLKLISQYPDISVPFSKSQIKNSKVPIADSLIRMARNDIHLPNV